MTFIILLLLLVLFSTYHIGFGFVPGAVPLRRQAAHQVSPFTPKVGRAIVNTPEKGKYEEEHRMPGEAVLPRVAERVNRETATRLYRGLGEDDVEEVVSILSGSCPKAHAQQQRSRYLWDMYLTLMS